MNIPPPGRAGLYNQRRQNDINEDESMNIPSKRQKIKEKFQNIGDYIKPIVKEIIKPQNITQTIQQYTIEEIVENSKKVLPDELFAPPGAAEYIPSSDTQQGEESNNVLFPLALRNYKPDREIEYNAHLALLGLTDMIRQVVGDDLLNCITDSDGLRKIFELTNPTVQCNNTVGRYVNGESICWICGSPIIDNNENFSQECEHVFPIAQAIMFTGLYAPKILDEQDEEYDDYIRLLQLEYYWSHMICNRVKNDTHFIDYANDEFFISGPKIELFLNEIINTKSYGTGAELCNYIGKTYRPTIRRNTYRFLDTSNKPITINNISNSDRKLGEQILLDRLPIIFIICNRIIEEYKKTNLTSDQLVNNVAYDIRSQIAKETTCIDIPVPNTEPIIKNQMIGVQNALQKEHYYEINSYIMLLKIQYLKLYAEIQPIIDGIIRANVERSQKIALKELELSVINDFINSLANFLYDNEKEIKSGENFQNEPQLSKFLEYYTINAFYEYFLIKINDYIQKLPQNDVVTNSLKTVYNEIVNNQQIQTIYNNLIQENNENQQKYNQILNIQQGGSKYGSKGLRTPKTKSTFQAYQNIHRKPAIESQKQTADTLYEEYWNQIKQEQKRKPQQQVVNMIDEEPQLPIQSNTQTEEIMNYPNIKNEYYSIPYKIENLEQLYQLVENTINQDFGLEVKPYLYDVNRYNDENFRNTYQFENNNITTSNQNNINDDDYMIGGKRPPLYCKDFNGNCKPKRKGKNV